MHRLKCHSKSLLFWAPFEKRISDYWKDCTLGLFLKFLDNTLNMRWVRVRQIKVRLDFTIFFFSILSVLHTSQNLSTSVLSIVKNIYDEVPIYVCMLRDISGLIFSHVHKKHWSLLSWICFGIFYVWTTLLKK